MEQLQDRRMEPPNNDGDDCEDCDDNSCDYCQDDGCDMCKQAKGCGCDAKYEAWKERDL